MIGFSTGALSRSHPTYNEGKNKKHKNELRDNRGANKKPDTSKFINSSSMQTWLEDEN
jgi:hypothetical protein